MDSARCSGPYERIPPAPGTNQIAGFVEFRPLTSRNKDKFMHIVAVLFVARLRIVLLDYTVLSFKSLVHFW